VSRDEISRCAHNPARDTRIPATSTVSLCHGYITEVELLFPAGHAGLTYLQIWHHERQIFPTTDGEAFRGDDHLIGFPERYPITSLWSPSAALEHTVYVDITVEAPPPVQVGEFTYVPLPEGV